MKILVISPYPILPPLHGSRVRTAQLAAALARAGATVAVLCPWYPGQPRSAALAERLTCHSHFFACNALPALVPRRLAPSLALLSLQPLSPFGPRRRLRKFLDADLFQFELCAYSRWVELLPRDARVVYSAHNVERDYWQAEAPGHALGRFWMRRIERLERLLVHRADLLVTCSTADAARMNQLYYSPRREVVIANGFDGSLLDLRRERLRGTARRFLGFQPEQRVVLFVGSDASHNLEAVDFMVHGVLPRLDPSTRLVVVGKSGSRLGKDRDGRVRSVGYVQDLRPLFAAADVAVNPVKHGSGSSIKLAEYLAAGLPVVSTPVGVRGWSELPAGVRVVPRALFADALQGPLHKPLENRAALERLTWARLGAELLGHYTALLR